jgi:hypothetical protein
MLSVTMKVDGTRYQQILRLLIGERSEQSRSGAFLPGANGSS